LTCSELNLSGVAVSGGATCTNGFLQSIEPSGGSSSGSSGTGSPYSSSNAGSSGYTVTCAAPNLSAYFSSGSYSSYTPPIVCLDEVSIVCCST